jgi:hypothetical protein
MSSDIIQNSNSNSNTLVEHDTSSLLDKKSPFDKPRTNYHLKHLGYTEKINIYAPISEQKVNLQQVLHEPRPVTVKSESDIEDEEDSDYVPEDGSDDESDSDFSSCESESNDENSDLETELIPSKGKTSSHRSSSLLSMAFWMPVYFLSFCILLLAFVITIDLSEDKYHFCELLTKASDVLEAGSNGNCF